MPFPRWPKRTLVRQAWDSAKTYSQEGRIYLNFPGHGEEGEALVRQSYGRNYKRLVDIKTKYGPGNVFRFNQNIQPERKAAS